VIRRRGECDGATVEEHTERREDVRRKERIEDSRLEGGKRKTHHGEMR
jgi:hypothetical protein